MARTLLNEEELERGTRLLPAWEMVDGRLHRELTFADFSAAWGFMTRVALVAELLGHHPEWSNVWNRVTIDCTTHDAGGITTLDLELARRIDELLTER